LTRGKIFVRVLGMDHTDDLVLPGKGGQSAEGGDPSLLPSPADTYPLEYDLEALWRLSNEILFKAKGDEEDGDPERRALALRDSIKVLLVAEKHLLSNETNGCYKGNT